MARYRLKFEVRLRRNLMDLNQYIERQVRALQSNLNLHRDLYNFLANLDVRSLQDNHYTSTTMTSPALIRSLTRLPPSFRPVLLRSPRALYHSYDRTQIPPYREPERAMLSSALSRVPTHGFTQEALALGAKDAGYLEVSTNLFPRSAFDLVLYHLVTQRVCLKERIQFPDEKIGVGRKVRSLVLERLRGNADAGVVSRWQEALAIMSLAENIPASLKELGALSDEIWFLSGDVAVDSSWYTKRASLAGIYAATEAFQTTDQSTDFKDTEEFLDRRLEELRTVGGAVSSTMEWAGFQASAMVNLLRSKGVRI